MERTWVFLVDTIPDKWYNTFCKLTYFLRYFVIRCHRLAKGTNVIGIQWRLNERKPVKHLSSTQQTITIHWLFGGKCQQNACGFILYSEGLDILRPRYPQGAGELRLLQVLFCCTMKTQKTVVSLLENREPWYNKFWFLSSFNMSIISKNQSKSFSGLFSL